MQLRHVSPGETEIMRAEPPAQFSTISSELLERIIAVPALPERLTMEERRRETLGKLSAAPLLPARVITSSYRVAECLIAAITGAAIAVVHPGEWDMTPYYIPMVLAVSLAFTAAAQLLGLYRIPALLRPVEYIARAAMIWTVVFAAIAVAVFMMKSGESYSRLWLASWYLGGLALIAAARALAAHFVRGWNAEGALSRHAVLVGGGQPAEDLVSALNASGPSDIRVVGIFDDRDDKRSPAQIGALPKLGTVSELIDFVRQGRIDTLLVTLPLTAEDRLLQVLKRLWVLPVDIRLSAYTQKFHYRPRAYSYIGNVPFLDVFDRPLGDWGTVLKSVEDKVIAAIALVLLAPVMLAVAIAVRLDSKGPVLFKQNRFGFNNELIGIYKFRSMHHDMRDIDAAKLVTKDDPRVTRVGRFIRRTSLDELPQLFNVLKGELSLVGPRPHPTKAKAGDQLYNDVVDGYFARHRVKPGITGWAQVNGWRGETDTTEKLQRRVEHDLYYIENWSLALDLTILWRTPFALLKAENAY
jgi:Undecaprenyl-phosphate glucose phosphotransferase